AEVNKIADLESREVLLAKVAGVLKALPTRAAGLFQAPLSQVARLAQALADKTPGDGSDAAEAGAPVEAATADSAEDSSADSAPAEAPTESPAEPAE
ncbi:MAG: 50S ribosomal protein L10, partial [Jatrophihabitantaceae bacterium]